MASCWMDDWCRDEGRKENISTVTVLRVHFVPASMRECFFGADLTGICSSPIVCIQCRDGESMAFQLLSSRCPYSVVLRQNTALHCLKLTSLVRYAKTVDHLAVQNFANDAPLRGGCISRPPKVYTDMNQRQGSPINCGNKKQPKYQTGLEISSCIVSTVRRA